MTDAERADTLTQIRGLADVAQQQAEELNGLLVDLRALLAEEDEEEQEGAGADARD